MKSQKPEHLEDLGGIVVNLINSVIEFKCSECGEVQTAIPDMQGLVRAAAIYRALNPIHISGKELRFIRRALDMTQKEFAERMELAVETLSRWENDVPGTGGMSEKLLRHNICALLAKDVCVTYDPAIITDMRIRERRAGEEIEPITLLRMRVKKDCSKHDAWDLAEAA